MARLSRKTRCTVCNHEDRVRIDYLLCTGLSDPETATRFGVVHDSVRRHRLNHITAEFRKSAKVGPFQSEERLRAICADTGTSVLESFRAIKAGLMHRWLVALETGNDAMLVQITAQVHKNLEKQALLTRELMPPGTVNVTNNFLSLDWFDGHARDLMRLANRHPEIRGELVDMLRKGVSDTPAAMPVITLEAEPVTIEGRANAA